MPPKAKRSRTTGSSKKKFLEPEEFDASKLTLGEPDETDSGYWVPITYGGEQLRMHTGVTHSPGGVHQYKDERKPSSFSMRLSISDSYPKMQRFVAVLNEISKAYRKFLEDKFPNDKQKLTFQDSIKYSDDGYDPQFQATLPFFHNNFTTAFVRKDKPDLAIRANNIFNHLIKGVMVDCVVQVAGGYLRSKDQWQCGVTYKYHSVRLFGAEEVKQLPRANQIAQALLEYTADDTPSPPSAKKAKVVTQHQPDDYDEEEEVEDSQAE